MSIERVVPDSTVSDQPGAVRQHEQVLGVHVVMDHGWVVTLADDEGHQLSLMTCGTSAPINPDVFVDDVHAAQERALAAGVGIVHPLTDKPWGVTRFIYRDVSGRVVNVGSHYRAAESK